MANDLNRETLPQQGNIYIWRGDYVEFDVDFLDAEDNPIPLDGYSGQAAIVQNNNEVARFDCEVGDGVVTLSMESTDSANLPPGLYLYDFQLVQNATGRVRTYLYGQVIVRGDVTVGI